MANANVGVANLNAIGHLDSGWYVAIGVIFTIATANVKTLNVITTGIMVVATIYQLSAHFTQAD